MSNQCFLWRDLFLTCVKGVSDVSVLYFLAQESLQVSEEVDSRAQGQS